MIAEIRHIFAFAVLRKHLDLYQKQNVFRSKTMETIFPRLSGTLT